MTTWSDLPSEVIEKILRPLEDTDLMNNLLRVDHKMKSIAGMEYFRRRDIGEFKPVVVDDKDIRLTLRALRTANWIKNISSLTVRLSLDYSVFRDIHNLAHFVRGLDSLGTLNFYLTEHSFWWHSGVPRINPPSVIKLRDLWWGCFRALLNAAFSKGLEGLHIYEQGPPWLGAYMDMRNRPAMLPTSFLRHEIAKGWFKLLSFVQPAGWYSKRISEYSTQNNCLCRTCTVRACRRAHIKEIRLSPMLLSPLFSYDTFSVLRAHASTIHTIHLGEVETRDYQGHWSAFFSEFKFPLLEQFTFTGSPSPYFTSGLTNINTILVFLNHHPAITYLELVNVPTVHQPEPAPTQEAPSLPNLKTLIARNDVAAHILRRPGNCDHLELLHLWSRPDIPFDVFVGIFTLGPGPALTAIASNASRIIKLEFRLQNPADCLRWMNEDADIPRRLTQVHDIKLLLADNTVQDESLLVDVLPRWLGSFPALEQLRVEVVGGYREVLRREILLSCFCLRLLTINNVVVFQKD